VSRLPPLYWHILPTSQIERVQVLLANLRYDNARRVRWAREELEEIVGEHGCSLSDFEQAAMEQWRACDEGRPIPKAIGGASPKTCAGCAHTLALVEQGRRRGWEQRKLPSRGTA